MADRGRTIAVGDIHGSIHALETVLAAIEPSAADTLVVLGDFIDQGRNTREVIDALMGLARRCQLVCLQGNHEEMFLAALTNVDAREYWHVCGGIPMLNSYRFGATIDVVPQSHIDFIRATRDYYETPDTIFVHASFDPDLPMPEQPTHLLRWGLIEPSHVRCHASGKPVICGHTEQASGEILDLGCVQCIDTACWRHGWLTAIDVESGQIWQASRFGMLREPDERPIGPIRAPQAS
jgi:serine/threonine protein phosphatase 1